MGRLRAANKQDPFGPTLFGALFGIASMSDGIHMTIGL